MLKIRRVVDSTLAWTLILIMAAMVVNVLWQVATRYILQSPSAFTDELARYLLVWVGILGASYATGKKLHLAIDILPSKATEKNKMLYHIAINVIVAIFALFIMVIGGLNLVYIIYTMEQYSAALEIPMAFVYMVTPISGLIIIFYSISNLFEKPDFGPLAP